MHSEKNKFLSSKDINITMKQEKKKDILITVILSALIIIAAAFIIGLRNYTIGKKILDSLAIIGGALQTVISVIIFRHVKKPYLKILAFLLFIRRRPQAKHLISGLDENPHNPHLEHFQKYILHFIYASGLSAKCLKVRSFPL